MRLLIAVLAVLGLTIGSAYAAPAMAAASASGFSLSLDQQNQPSGQLDIDIDLNMGDYETNYGTNNPAEAETYTGEIVRDAANQRFKQLGWATIIGAPQD